VYIVFHTTVRIRIPTAVHRVLSRNDDPRVPTYIYFFNWLTRGSGGCIYIGPVYPSISGIHKYTFMFIHYTITIRLNNYYRMDRVLQHRGMLSNRKVNSAIE